MHQLKVMPLPTSGKTYSVVQIPLPRNASHSGSGSPPKKTKTSPSQRADIFNIAMVDVSGSMSCAYPHVHEAWNDAIAHKLTGDY